MESLSFVSGESNNENASTVSSPFNDTDKKAGEDSEPHQETRQEKGDQDQTQEEDG